LYGIDRTNLMTIEGIVRDLICLDKSTTNHDLLQARMSNGKIVSLVCIPKSPDPKRIRCNDRDQDEWLPKLLANLRPSKKYHHTQGLFKNKEKATEENGATKEVSDDHVAATNLLEYIGIKHPAAFIEAAEQRSVLVHEAMDAVETFSMWSDANMNDR
jgi:hypothetical protein